MGFLDAGVGGFRQRVQARGWAPLPLRALTPGRGARAAEGVRRREAGAPLRRDGYIDAMSFSSSAAQLAKEGRVRMRLP